LTLTSNLVSLEKSTRNLLDLAFISIVSLGIILRFYNIEGSPWFWWDEGTYIGLAYNLVTEGKFGYGVYEGPFPGPPLVPLLLALVFKIFGPNILALRGLSALIGSATSVIIYALCIRKYDRYVGLFSVIIFTISQQVLRYNRMVLQDPFMTFFTMLAIYLSYKERYFLAGISLGLSLLSKWPAICMVLFFFLELVVFERKRKPFLLLVSSSFMILLTWIVWGLTSTGLLGLVSWQAGRYVPTSLTKLFIEVAQVDAYLLMLGCLGIVYSIVSERDRFIALYFITWSAMLMIIGTKVGTHYVFPLFPIFCISAGLLIKNSYLKQGYEALIVTFSGLYIGYDLLVKLNFPRIYVIMPVICLLLATIFLVDFERITCLKSFFSKFPRKSLVIAFVLTSFFLASALNTQYVVAYCSTSFNDPFYGAVNYLEAHNAKLVACESAIGWLLETRGIKFVEILTDPAVRIWHYQYILVDSEIEYLVKGLTNIQNALKSSTLVYQKQVGWINVAIYEVK